MKINKQPSGFTIVELLIVVVVIAILAAITIAAYNGIVNNAKISALKADLSQAATKLELYKIDNNAYPPNQAAMESLLSAPSTTFSYLTNNSASPPSYCAIGSKEGLQFSVGSANQTPGTDVCAINSAIQPRGDGFNTNGLSPSFWNDRWGPYGTYSLLTGQTPPSGTDITTAVRYSSTTAGSSRGFQLAGNPDLATPGVNFSKFSVTAGDVYTISLWMRTSQSGMQFVVRARPAIDANSWVDVGRTSSAVSATAGQWVRVSLTYTVPSGANGLEMYAIIGGSSPNLNVGETVDATGLMVTKGSTLYNYADGNSSGWNWAGTQSGSYSFGPPL